VLEATVRHGRDDPGAAPSADTLTADLRGLLPAGVDIGSEVSLVAELDGQLFPRFAGRVTDLATGYGRNVDDPIAQLVAAGALAGMGHRIIGDEPWPTELDGARVNRIIGLAGVPTDPLRTDPGTVELLGRDVDAQPALEVAQAAAGDAGGIVWQATDGAVLYADADHRRGTVVALELDACLIPAGDIRWGRTLEGLVNDLRVRYGVAPEGSEQPELRRTDPASIAARGTYAASVTTQLLDEAAAASRADDVIVRQADPAWTLSGVTLDLGLFTRELGPVDDLEHTLAVLGLEVHDLVALSGMPAGSPATQVLLFVEGWVEQVRWGAWSLQLVTSDYCRTVPAPRWDDVDPGWTWDTVDPALTWDGSTCLPPLGPGPGRWSDVPSTTRWDTVPAAATWDTWEG
jgi:hypothetical protein